MSLSGSAVSVRDTGIGLKKEFQKTCFDKYTTRGGTGLGLYLTKLQTQALGGDITITSPLPQEAISDASEPVATDEKLLPRGPGTEVKVTLLLTVAEAPAVPVAIESPPIPELREEIRVLIADDIAANCFVLAGSLRYLGCHTQIVHKSEEVLELLQQPMHQIDLLIIDEMCVACRGLDVLPNLLS